MVGGALLPPFFLFYYIKQQATSGGGQFLSAHVNVPTSIITLHTPVPLSLILREEKGDTPILTQTQACIKWSLSCASKRKLCVNNDAMHAPDMCKV